MEYKLRIEEHGVASIEGDSMRTELGPKARTLAEWRNILPTMKWRMVDPEGGEHRIDLSRWKNSDPLTLISISVWYRDPKLVGTFGNKHRS